VNDVANRVPVLVFRSWRSFRR